MQQTLNHNLLEQVLIRNELFFRIADTGTMRPFFMSIVSHADHWLFTSSNGGITAGRKNPDFSIFPYCTDDKVADNAEYTGSKTIIRLRQGAQWIIWEPFSIRSEGHLHTTRNIYKNRFGNKIIFEEINHDHSLCFRYEWNLSERYGFVKRSSLQNLSSKRQTISLADGLQNVLPYGVDSDLQTKVSNLADAYKRTELDTSSGMAIFALSAIIVDKAEPSEALKANVAWSAGLEDPVYLLSALQLPAFRNGDTLTTETDSKAEKGAFFTVSEFYLEAQQTREWITVAEVNLDQSAVIALAETLQDRESVIRSLHEDVESGAVQLAQMIAAADGIQYTADTLQDTRHVSNVLFNIMRGGIFDNNYTAGKKDFADYLQATGKLLLEKEPGLLDKLPAQFSLFELNEFAANTGNPDLVRLTREYLPLKFSRRHGDPSRPWNRFSIELRNELDGTKVLNYEGNWRDIFQNWEALAHAYPYFIEGMISKFLNASTFDGYNPYRITKDGFDWETIEPDNPWSYIGYWGDHQLIYLLKLLEFSNEHFPELIPARLQQEAYVYANVPYKIKSYADIVKDPKNTIDFDHDADKTIRERFKCFGADGALLTAADGNIYRVNFAEKILATVLAKLINFIPCAGIWMNTQRPEWNDANNALVGNGVSVVTLCYLRRFLHFFLPVLESSKDEKFSISEELFSMLQQMMNVFEDEANWKQATGDDAVRKNITDVLGHVASDYREKIYNEGFSGKKDQVPAQLLIHFFRKVISCAEHTISQNKRSDHLYHAYNTVRITEQGIVIARLSEMLEGQVAVLSAGHLSPEESRQLLDALAASALWREDQQSYLLYPDKPLARFLEKNNVPATAVEASALLKKMLAENNTAIIKKDNKGGYHFNGNFRNAGELAAGLAALPAVYQPLVEQEQTQLLAVYEEVFHHQSFTGRSGTFYGYEGLGSIYWHMVSKLVLAVQETCLRAIEAGADISTREALIGHYYTIRAGIGIHKSPRLYGAFPTDPYSHTPKGKGAQQPGMTGQVKEDILSRIGELGVKVKAGRIGFEPRIMRRSELLPDPDTVISYTSNGDAQPIQLPAGSVLFTCCTVPVCYKAGEKTEIQIQRANGAVEHIIGSWLSEADSRLIWKRSGEIRQLTVILPGTAFI
ncbi:MAG: hypothetical protein NTW29_20980 [Bacteroidetes bacterium]|nr:hypothetical protein [Bacteroidota bacterium]